MMESVFVVYRDGKRLEREEVKQNLKTAYLKRGSANGIIMKIVSDTLKEKQPPLYNKEKWLAVEKEERKRYSVVEFVPKVQEINARVNISSTEAANIVAEVLENKKAGYMDLDD